MKMNLNAVVVAGLAAVAMGGAQAGVANVNASSLGNSSLLFVATDNTNQVMFVADLGLSMSDMLQSSSFITSKTSVTWNFADNTASLGSITGNSWSDAYGTFKSTQSGGDLKWAVVAGDQIQSGTAATNAITGRGLMATGNVTVAQMTAASTSAPTGTGLGNLSSFISAAALRGTTTTANNGAGVTTDGDTITGVGAMGGTFGGAALSWNYLISNGVSSTFQYQQQTVANPVVFQIGKFAGSAADTLNADPVTFTFDVNTNSLVLAVPEPSTYALMLAGLVGVGFLARRRQG